MLNEKKTARNIESITEKGLVCKKEPKSLAINYIRDELVAVSPDGRLYLFDTSSKKVRWSIPTGEPLHVSYQSSDNNAPFIFLRGDCRRVYLGTNDSEIKDLGCHAREFVADPCIYLNGLTIVHSKLETNMYVNLGTGQLSPSTSSDEILRITRFDCQLICYKPTTDIVLWYRRFATFKISVVSRDVPARMGETLIKLGTTGKISRSGRVIGKGGKDTVLVKGEYQQPAVILCIKKGQSDDDAFKNEVSFASDVCDENHTFVKVHGMESDRDFNYVAREYCGTSLREFIPPFHNPGSQHLMDYKKLLTLIWESVKALAWLHCKGISHGNLNLDNIFVDKYSRAKILVISLSKDATDDMLRHDIRKLGRVIFFCFTRFEYNGENLTQLKPSHPYLKPIYDRPDALDLLRKLLDTNPAQRATALQASNHTLFWSLSKSLSKNLRFIRDITERLDLKESPLRKIIESIKEAVFGESWKKGLPTKFLKVMEDENYGYVMKDESGRKHKYDYSRVYDLLCIIRNLMSHEMSIKTQIKTVPKEKEVLEMFGPAGFGSYFQKKYPKLVNEVYNVMIKHLEGEAKFLEYYKESPL